MIALSAIQAEARTLLRAHPTLASEIILLGSVLLLFPIASVARTGNVATIVTQSPHGLITGARVDLDGITSAAFNDTHQEITVLSPTSFSYANTGSDLATTADTTGTVRGLETDLAEFALRTRGHCLTVFPPLSADTVSQASGKASVDVSVVVRVEVNLEKATVNALTLVEAVAAALIKRVCQPVDRYLLDDPAVIIDDTDPGLLSYLVYFKRNAQFQPST